MIFFVFFVFSALGQKTIQTENDLLTFLSGKNELIDHVLNNREKYHLQLVYTGVHGEGDSMNFSTIDLTTGQYFYPASVVKLPAALLTLEKLNKLDLSRKDILKINEDLHCGNQKFADLSRQRDISFEEMIDELIVVSNNDYYNSLYHFLTPGEINNSLAEKGLSDTHIYKSFTGCGIDEQLKCNSIEVRRGKDVVYQQELCVLDMGQMIKHYDYTDDKLLGSKHEYEREIVNGPFDFNYNLEMPLDEIHQMMLRLIYPDNFPEHERWNLREEDRLYLIDVLQKYPRELGKKEYLNREKYPDNIYKYILIGEGNPNGVRTVSKIGLSYGFSTETAYIQNESTTDFFLSISLYTNANDIVNDGDYEYNELARPFMARVAKLLSTLE